MESHGYRDTLAHFATGVVLISAIAEDGSAIGLTTDSFTPVSYDPQLVLWCIDKASPHFWEFVHNRYLSISVLGCDQRDLADLFAAPGQNKFESLSWKPGLGGVPVLDNMAIVLECQNRNQHDAGDHIILLCEVKNYHCNPTAPLLYCEGEFVTIVSVPVVENAKIFVG